MRIALCNEVLAVLPFDQQCATAAALGYDGLEIAPFTLDREAPHLVPAARRSAMRQQAQAAGIAITSLHWLMLAPEGLSITTADPTVRALTLDVIERLIALAGELGAKIMVHGSPKQRRITADGDAERAEATMAKAGDWAASAGITYCLEPLPPPGAEWARNIAEAAAIVRRIDNPNLRTMLDVCAIGTGGETAPATALIETWVPTGLVAHMHFNDRNRRAPGQGEDRFGPILQALRTAGYTGMAAVEPFDYIPDGPGAAARAIGYLRGCEEALA